MAMIRWLGLCARCHLPILGRWMRYCSFNGRRWHARCYHAAKPWTDDEGFVSACPRLDRDAL